MTEDQLTRRAPAVRPPSTEAAPGSPVTRPSTGIRMRQPPFLKGLGWIDADAPSRPMTRAFDPKAHRSAGLTTPRRYDMEALLNNERSQGLERLMRHSLL